MQLQSSGALDDDDTKRSLRTQVQVATEGHSKFVTPYGPVVQRIRIGAHKLEYWENCHPFAYLWYMTHISPTFADAMMRRTRVGRPLRLVIFADELCPGNPFRPEKSRTLMCIYWSFIDC